MLDKICLILAIIGGLNWGSIGLFGFDFVASDIRKTRVEFNSVLEKTHKGKIVIPAEMKIVGLPEELVIESAYLKYKGGFKQEKNIIYYENVYYRNGTQIPVEDYLDFRAGR